MLRLTLSTEEYLQVGENVKIVFLGGSGNHLRIMVDAPKDVHIVRSKLIEKATTDPAERARLPKFYAEPELPEKYRKKKGTQKQDNTASNTSKPVIIVKKPTTDRNPL